MSNADMEQQEEHLAARIAQQNRLTKNTMPATKEWVDLSTEILWHRFQSLKRRGFTDDQAMELLTRSVL